jgi:beta-glucosidase
MTWQIPPSYMYLWFRDDFTAYADACFREFGDRVAHWTTILEPNILAQGSYDNGIVPPGHCSPPFGRNCTVGNSSVEPYLFLHNTLLAHSSAVRLYREQYQVRYDILFLQSFMVLCTFLLMSTWKDQFSHCIFDRFQAAQKGVVGINLYSLAIYPLTGSPEDNKATERANDFLFGWYVIFLN